jgi:hypothetical protein
MRALVRSTVVALSLAAACGSPTASDRPATSATVLVTRVAGAVRVENRSSEPIGYAVWNPHWLGLLGPCTTEPGCPVLAPGQAGVVRDEAMAGYVTGMAEAVAYWWPIRADASGRLTAGPVVEQRVALR